MGGLKHFLLISFLLTFAEACISLNMQMFKIRTEIEAFVDFVFGDMVVSQLLTYICLSGRNVVCIFIITTGMLEYVPTTTNLRNACVLSHGEQLGFLFRVNS